MRRFKWFVFLVLLFAFTTVVYAQETDVEVSDDEVNRVARELYCPICENTPLDVCETQACQDWRDEIRKKLAAGQSDQQIIEYFAGIYGERARATPTTTGFSKWVWIAPVVLVVGSVGYLVYLLRRWLARGAAVADGGVAPALDAAGEELDEYVARLEREIRESA